MSTRQLTDDQRAVFDSAGFNKAARQMFVQNQINNGVSDDDIWASLDKMYSGLTGSPLPAKNTATEEQQPNTDMMGGGDQTWGALEQEVPREALLDRIMSGDYTPQELMDNLSPEEQAMFDKTRAPMDQRVKDANTGSAGAAFVEGLADSASWGLSNYAPRIAENIPGGEGSRQSGNEWIKNTREEHPIASTAGNIVGFFTPGGVGKLVSKGIVKGSEKAAAKVLVNGGSKFAAKAAQIGTEAALGAGQWQVQQLMGRAAGTREWDSIANTTKDYFVDTGAGVLMGTIFRGATPAIARMMSSERRAITKLGGVEKFNAAIAARDEAIRLTGSIDEGASAFMAEATKGMSDDAAKSFSASIRSDSQFRKIIGDAALAGKTRIDNSIDHLTRNQTTKIAREGLEELKRGQELGASRSFDTSEQGVKQMLGLDSKGYRDVAEAAAGKANAMAAADESVAHGIKSTTQRLGRQVSQAGDVDGVRSVIKSADFGDFSYLKNNPQLIEARAGEKIQKMQAAAQQSGQGLKLTQNQIQQIKADSAKELAGEYAQNIFFQGTSSPVDVTDMKELLAAAKNSEIASGRGTALGAYREALNTQVLENAHIFGDEVARAYQGLNNMTRMADPITEGHRLAANFDVKKTKELANFLDPTNLVTDEIVARKLGVQMGYIDSVKNAMVAGDTKTVSQLSSMAKNNKHLREVFEGKNLSEWIGEMRPEIDAAKKINNIIKSANSIDDSIGTEGVKSIAKMATAITTFAPIAFVGEVLRASTRTSMAPSTMRKIEQMAMAANDGTFTWQMFNKVADGITDLAQKKQFNRAVSYAVSAANANVNR